MLHGQPAGDEAASKEGRLAMLRREIGSRFAPGNDMVFRVGLLVVVFLGMGLTRGNFKPSVAAWGSLSGSTTVCMLGLAVATTMMAGELDLSFAAVAGLSSIVAVQFIDQGVLLAIVVALAVAVVIGVIQGIAVAFLPIQSIVLTLGTMITLGGVQLLVTHDGETATAQNYHIASSVNEKFWIFTPLSIAMLVIVIGYALALRYTRFGTRLHALGASRDEALLAGVRRRPMMIIIFTLSATFAGVGGVMAGLSSVSASAGGFDQLLIAAIAVALIGGVRLSGGIGGPVNVLVGALILVTLKDELAARGVASEVASLATAGLLAAALVGEILTDRSLLTRFRSIQPQTEEAQ